MRVNFLQAFVPSHTLFVSGMAWIYTAQTVRILVKMKKWMVSPDVPSWVQRGVELLGATVIVGIWRASSLPLNTAIIFPLSFLVICIYETLHSPDEDDFNLYNRYTRQIDVSEGTCRWINDKLIEFPAHFIKAKNGIELKGVACDGMTTTRGGVKCENCFLHHVQAVGSVELTTTQCNEINLIVPPEGATITLKQSHVGEVYMRPSADVVPGVKLKVKILGKPDAVDKLYREPDAKIDTEFLT